MIKLSPKYIAALLKKSEIKVSKQEFESFCKNVNKLSDPVSELDAFINKKMQEKQLIRNMNDTDSNLD